ncbi:MAG: hypothetical protein FIB00_16650 [Chloroflexi bacterium]|nr:hypothetical protein [Chloroflexota bacterium]PWB43401.1 MAG: hypothetical protein C3F10_12000 [Dehalococcoidia bacterium]
MRTSLDNAHFIKRGRNSPGLLAVNEPPGEALAPELRLQRRWWQRANLIEPLQPEEVQSPQHRLRNRERVDRELSEQLHRIGSAEQPRWVGEIGRRRVRPEDRGTTADTHREPGAACHRLIQL